MNKISRYLLILGCFLTYPLVSRADDQLTGEKITGIQISLLNPAQIYSEDYSVEGFRWDILYGVNKDVQGLDIGFVNNATGSVQAFELGAVNIVKRDFKGVQLGLITNTDRSCDGLQMAVFYNNTDEEIHGLQLGIVNHTGSLDGVQIGILNFNDDRRYLGFLPFINAAF